MKTNNLAVNTIVAMKRAVVGIGLIGVGLLGITPLALANSNENEDVAAPYLHFAAPLGAATGPYTTHFLVSSMETASTVNVNVKCYNDSSQRVGPAAGTTIPVAFHGLGVIWLTSLPGVTTDPLFTGIGWCYFTSNTSYDIAVSFLMGISVGNSLIATNNSVGIVADTAQGMVSNSDANIPYWTNEGSWVTLLLALNPTATARTMVMSVYNAAASLLSSGAIVGFTAARDMGVALISASSGTFGVADIDITGRGFAGWILGFNVASYESFMYQVPLDSTDTSRLISTDRP